MSSTDSSYDVQVDWRTVVPMGDTLAVHADADVDDQWVKAFQVVLDEHARRPLDRSWRRIDFKYAAHEDVEFVLFVREIEPDARAFEVRQTIDGLIRAANDVARVGTHVYELARELRDADTAAVRGGSVPPPSFDPLEDELDADAA